MKRKTKIAIAAVLLLSLCFSAPAAAADGTNVEYRTIPQVNSYIQLSGANVSDSTSYATTPSTTAPYNPGTLTPGSLDSALKMVNQIRYVAGIDYDVTLNPGYTEKAQACALVNAANNSMSHNPTQPPGMEPALYALGKEGAGSSNIGMGNPILNSVLINGWMHDGDAYNIATLGHRRWVLNPTMAATGFGKVNIHTAMYVFDRTRASGYKGVAWPAQNMPLDYFRNDMPWSISMGVAVDITKVEVTLKRASDGKIWRFSNKKADGYFNVDNQGFGASGCIIFRPASINYLDGDVFNVSITGANVPVKYKVKFFKLGTNPPSLVAPSKVTGVKTTVGKKKMTVSWKKVAGANGYQLVYATNKSFTKGKKTISISNGTTVKKTIKKLKKGKVYYVKVQAYKVVSGQKLTGPYSNPCKTKKIK